MMPALRSASSRIGLAALLVLAAVTWLVVTSVHRAPEADPDAVWFMGLPVVAEHSAASSDDLKVFGDWSDRDGDGCDTRMTVLAEQSVPSDDDCLAPVGPWISRWDGATIAEADGAMVVRTVPLGEAFASGAYAWSPEDRAAFANDTDLNGAVVVTSLTSARARADRGPAQWLPAFERCRYVADWLAVKRKYGLAVDRAEAQALTEVLAGCPDAPSGHEGS